MNSKQTNFFSHIILGLNNKWATLSTWNWEHQNYEKNDVQIRFNDDCKNALSNSYRSIDIESGQFVCAYDIQFSMN